MADKVILTISRREEIRPGSPLYPTFRAVLRESCRQSPYFSNVKSLQRWKRSKKQYAPETAKERREGAIWRLEDIMRRLKELGA